MASDFRRRWKFRAGNRKACKPVDNSIFQSLAKAGKEWFRITGGAKLLKFPASGTNFPIDFPATEGRLLYYRLAKKGFINEKNAV